MLSASDFIGLWQLRRTIDDRYAPQTGLLSGTVKFLRNDDSAVKYLETGKVRFGDGPVMQTQRQYIWRFSGDRVDVSFEDASPFHSFVPEGKRDGTDHPCGDDFYRVTYDFCDWPTWTTTWTVCGPRKDYTMISEYSGYSASGNTRADAASFAG